MASVFRGRSALPLPEELGIGFAPFSPLGAGFLTGPIDEHTQFNATDFRNPVTRLSMESRRANIDLVDVVKAVAAAKKATRAQAALAWLLAQRSYISPIPGTTKLHWLDENLGAVDLALDGADLARISASGARLPEAALKMTGQQARPTIPARPGPVSQICAPQTGIVPVESCERVHPATGFPRTPGGHCAKLG